MLRYPLAAEPTSLDPVTITDPSTLDLLQNVFQGLVQFDENNRVVPGVADRWTISPDGRVYTFHLHENARFHNGRLMTADDVLYSLNRALWPETKSPVAANYLAGIVGMEDVAAGRMRSLRGVRVVDPHTLVITLTRPRGYFLGELAYSTAWVYCREAIEAAGGRITERSAIGTGPFRIAEYRHGAKVVLQAFRDYWGGRPKVDWIERPIVIDGEVAHMMYESGELDVCPISLTNYLTDRKDPQLARELQLQPMAAVNYLAFGEGGGSPFHDARVRQAFARAIDRDRIAQIAYVGASPRADSLLPPGIPGSDPHFPRIPFDPSSARRLLAAAGYPGGRGFPHLKLVFGQKDTAFEAAASLIREDLRQNLGITVDLEQMELAQFMVQARAHRLTFHLNTWTADYLDPEDFLPTLLRTGAAVNRWSYSNPTFDRLCDQAESEPNEQRRIDLYRQADRLAMGEVALLPLTYGESALLVKPYVHGFKTSLMGFLPENECTVDRK